MANVAQAQKTDFSIIVYENPKNLRTIWNALEKHWRYRNTIVWHLSNRVQGFSAKYKFFSKHDVALVGTSGEVVLNDEPEDDPLFQEQRRPRSSQPLVVRTGRDLGKARSIAQLTS